MSLKNKTLMKLFTFLPAPNPQRVNYLLKYKGITLDTQEINLRAQEQFSPAFLQLNPLATVPALQVSEQSTLTDAIAICVYLERLYPEKPLFGTTDLEYAEIIGWLHSIYNDGLSAIGEVLRNGNDLFVERALPGQTPVPQIAELVERGKLRLLSFWQRLEHHLTDRQFIVGNQLSQADIDAYVACNFASWIKEAIPDECTALKRWHQQVMAILDS